MAEKILNIENFPSDVDGLPPPINIISFDSYRIRNNSLNEIVEEEDDEDDDGHFLPSINEEEDLFSYDFDRNVGDHAVYVVTWIGTEELSSASIEALLWTLGSSGLHDSTIVYLVHVFPELHFIPTPLGRLPISHANPEQKEGYVSKERSKRSEYLQKFISLCTSSKVQVETVLIESDLEAKAILDLIPILNIRKLVLGATKSNLRKLSKKGGGGGTLGQILQNAPNFCEVKVICEGKEVLLQEQLTSEPPSPSPSNETSVSNVNNLKPMQQDPTNDFIRCSCFKL